ncbi:MAG: rhomboid family intramembrane serine protease [Gammaproteobacteria bacterium]|nr:rhomboid family intramembrane serine protease [Gammaproteobacteria bacterium]
MSRSINGIGFFLFFIALIWGVAIVDLFLETDLTQYAVRPRDPDRLTGVVFMHFLHNDFNHLLSNTVPLLVLGYFVTLLDETLKVSFIVMIVTGLLVWLFARDGIHAGASGLVMGYWGYLISNAFFERSLKNISVAVITLLVYGGVVFTLFDIRAAISFEGHIFGFFSGIFSAWLLAIKSTKTQQI